MSLPTRVLGRNGPQVTAIGVGLMSLGHAYGNAGDDESRLAYLDDLYNMGERFWDDADIYGDSETLVGKWLAKNPEKRKDIFLATKFGFLGLEDMSVRSDPEWIYQAVEKSLKKLQTDYIDLYYCHRVDGKTPIEETVKAMAGLKKQGKIHYLGLSEVSAATLRRAHAVHPISAVQTEYSPFALDIEFEATQLLQTCKELGIALVAYSPLGRGFLAGQIKSRKDVENDWRAHMPKYSEENFPKNLQLVDMIKAIAEKKGVTTGQITLAWLLAQWEMIIPIPGSRRSAMVQENVKAIEVKLTDAEKQEIREASENAGVFGDRYPDALMHQLFADTPELKPGQNLL